MPSPNRDKLRKLAGVAGAIDAQNVAEEAARVALPDAAEKIQNAGTPGVAGEPPKSSEELQQERPEGVQKIASLTALMASQSEEFQDEGQQYAYAEEGDLRNALQSASVVDSQLQQLGTMSAQQRAEVGAKFGGGVGLQANGPYGGIAGAAIGSVVARAAGMVQSGELEDGKRKKKVVGTLNTLGVVDDKGFFNFEDGSSFFINPDPNAVLENNSAMSGERTRSIFSIDPSNPFSRRTTAVARPLAYFLAQGLLRYQDPKNDSDKKVLDNTTGLLVNALQKDADSIDSVYTRAQELAKKFGVTEEGLRAFFDSNKNKIPEVDAINIRQGLDILFMGNRE